MNVAANLQELIDRKELKISELAEKIPVSRQTVYGWLQGKPIRHSYISRLADIFGVSESQICFGQQVSVLPDLNLLTEIIREIRTEANIRSLILTPEQESRLYVALYEQAVEYDPSHPTVEKSIVNRYLNVFQSAQLS